VGLTGVVTVSLQITAVIGPLIEGLSVVSVGVVQCSLTSSPTRDAVSPVEITAGRFRVGGNGGPGLAHPVSRTSVIPAPVITRRNVEIIGSGCL
jgi:hypothetical protein